MKRRGPTSVALLGAIGAALWARPAGAYCRETIARPPDGYDPQASGCWVGTDEAGAPAPALYWRNVNVSYSFEQDVDQFVPVTDAERIASEAFAAWTSNAWCTDGGGPPSLRAFEFPQVTCDVVPSQANPFIQHNNPIIFRQGTWPYDNVNALGYTTLTFDQDTGEIYGATIEINASSHPIVVDPDGPLPDGSYDLGSILTHEAGHFLGLAHSADTTAVMYAFYHPPTTTLRQDDLSGICELYPPDNSRSTTAGSLAATQCDPTPARGFSLDCESDGGDSNTMTCLPPGDSGADAADASDPQPCSTDWLFACGIGRAGGAGGGTPLVASGAVALVGLLRRLRAAIRRGRTARNAVVGVGVALGFAIFSSRDATASVSIAATLPDLVRRATAVALVTPLESEAAWEQGRIVTHTRLRVDRLAAGQAPDVVRVRAFGGVVGHVGQIVEGEATFEVGRPTLVFLSSRGAAEEAVVVEGAQGEFPIVEEAGRRWISRARNVGAIVPLSPAAVAHGVVTASAALEGRSVDEALGEVATAWSREHLPRR